MEQTLPSMQTTNYTKNKKTHIHTLWTDGLGMNQNKQRVVETEYRMFHPQKNHLSHHL